MKEDSLFFDALDLKILQSLQEDSRQTYAGIGECLGVAHSTVYDRIRRMEKEKVIKQYTAVVDAEKIGVRNITASVTVYADPKEIEKVAAELAEQEEVLEVYTSLSEELLVMAKICASSQEALHEFIANCVAPLPGVLRIRTSIATKKFKEAQFVVTGSSKRLRL